VGVSDKLGTAVGCDDGIRLVLGPCESDGWVDTDGLSLGPNVGSAEADGIADGADDGTVDMLGSNEG